MLRPYSLRVRVRSPLAGPVARGRMNLHLRHHAIGEPGTRRKLRKLDQLQNDLALPVGFDAAERTIGEVDRPGGGQKPLRPELDFVGSEMHEDVSHWVSYGLVLSLVSVPAIFQITTQFITGPMDISFDRAQGQIQGIGDLLVGIPLDVT